MSVIMEETAKYGFRDGITHHKVSEEIRELWAREAEESRLRFEEQCRIRGEERRRRAQSAKRAGATVAELEKRGGGC